MPSLCYQITLHSENSDSEWSRSINDVYVVRCTLYDDRVPRWNPCGMSSVVSFSRHVIIGIKFSNFLLFLQLVPWGARSFQMADTSTTHGSPQRDTFRRLGSDP
jgi:hypothetical protein